MDIKAQAERQGDGWVVTCPESKALEVEFLEEVFTHVDEYVLVKITGGERVFASSSKKPERVGDLTMLRTITGPIPP